MNVRHIATIATIAKRLISSDCLVPLRTMLLGGVAALLTLFALQTYAKRAGDRVERIRRLGSP